jgi:hypothetical protein
MHPEGVAQIRAPALDCSTYNVIEDTDASTHAVTDATDVTDVTFGFANGFPDDLADPIADSIANGLADACAKGPTYGFTSRLTTKTSQRRASNFAELWQLNLQLA